MSGTHFFNSTRKDESADFLTLVFKEGDTYTEMNIVIMDQSTFVEIAYALLSVCPGGGTSSV